MMALCTRVYITRDIGGPLARGLFAYVYAKRVASEIVRKRVWVWGSVFLECQKFCDLVVVGCDWIALSIILWSDNFVVKRFKVDKKMAIVERLYF